MSRANRHTELLGLVEALCNGTQTAERHARLQELLAADADARQFYFDYLDLHLALKQSALQLPAARRRPRRWPAAVAAAVFFGLGFLYVSVRRVDAAPVATLIQSASARFYGAGEALRVGGPVDASKEYALRAGRVEVRFSSGATAILEGPAVFEVRDAMRLRVAFGKCSVLVPPGAEGFAVETPLTRIVDRGTRFAVDVDDGGETEVQVVEGKADVLIASAAPVTLNEGDGRRYEGGAGRDVPYDRRRFPMDMPDRVVRYTTSPRSGSTGAELLTGVTVRRGGRELVYETGQLIGVRLLHFKNTLKNGKFIATVTDGADPGGALRLALTEDDANINTGVINPGGSASPLTTDPVMNDPEDPRRPNTPGMALRFVRPLTNDAGPDLVVFDFQPVIQPEYGDPFHVSPLRFEGALHSHTVVRFDMATFSPEAQVIAGFRLNGFERPVTALSQLRSIPFKGSNFTVTCKLLAVGVDLSDLGYAPGATVDGIFIQDVLDDGNQIDPVFIGGLPPLEKK